MAFRQLPSRVLALRPQPRTISQHLSRVLCPLRTFCDKAPEPSTTSNESSVAEENKARALKYMREKLQYKHDIEYSSTTIEEEDETKGESENSGTGYSDFFSEEGSAGVGVSQEKMDASRRVTKYIPEITGRVPDIGTLQSLLVNEHGALDFAAVDVSQKASFADTIVVVTALSRPHLIAIADGIQKDMIALDIQVGNKSVPICGRNDQDGNWIIVDVGPIVIHVMTEEARQYYQLESLWSEEYDDHLHDGEEEDDGGKRK